MSGIFPGIIFGFVVQCSFLCESSSSKLPKEEIHGLLIATGRDVGVNVVLPTGVEVRIMDWVICFVFFRVRILEWKKKIKIRMQILHIFSGAC